MQKYDLEDRLIEFSLLIMGLVSYINNSINGSQLAKQLSRSGTSVSLNYGEAISAESKKDFIHKMNIVLKELRETRICLKLITRGHLCAKQDKLKAAVNECSELILIFSKSNRTARKNFQNSKVG